MASNAPHINSSSPFLFSPLLSSPLSSSLPPLLSSPIQCTNNWSKLLLPCPSLPSSTLTYPLLSPPLIIQYASSSPFSPDLPQAPRLPWNRTHLVAVRTHLAADLMRVVTAGRWMIPIINQIETCTYHEVQFVVIQYPIMNINITIIIIIIIIIIIKINITIIINLFHYYCYCFYYEKQFYYYYHCYYYHYYYYY